MVAMVRKKIVSIVPLNCFVSVIKAADVSYSDWNLNTAVFINYNLHDIY